MAETLTTEHIQLRPTDWISSIPLYQGSGLDLTCTNCFLSLQQSGLYLSVDYDSNGFENIHIEADVNLLANLDLSFSYDGDGDIVYTDPLVTDYTIFSIPFPVAGISFAATIEASLTAVMAFQGSGTLFLNTGITCAACALLDHCHLCLFSLSCYSGVRLSSAGCLHLQRITLFLMFLVDLSSFFACIQVICFA